jgi:general secretion pathway protein N
VILGKKIALVLGSTAAALGLLAGGLMAGVGTGYSLDEPDPSAGEGTTPLALAGEPVKLRPSADYAMILSRPLFNESRAPEIEEAAPEADAAATQPLDVKLTGVILTRGVQLALVTDPAKNETERVRIGQPLTGTRAGWTLVELKPRLAVFDGAGLGRTELELSIDTQGAAPVTPPAPPAVPNPAMPVAAAPQPAGSVPPPPAQAPGQPASAEEIRRRIEERRRQLREEAQKMLEQNNQQ